jgi:hypothetical protein
MPDSSGALTAADNEKIQRWWAQHWKSPVTCPVCKTSAWTAAPHIVNVPRFAADALAGNTQTYPFIIVSCNTCFHSMFFNAVPIGIAPAYSAPAPPQPQTALGVASLGANLLGSLSPAQPSNPFDLIKKDK